jgi:hypothetical protein
MSIDNIGDPERMIRRLIQIVKLQGVLLEEDNKEVQSATRARAINAVRVEVETYERLLGKTQDQLRAEASLQELEDRIKAKREAEEV